MKKITTILASLLILASTCLAQGNIRRIPEGKKARIQHVKLNHKTNKPTTSYSAKSAGDTISSFPWNEGFESTTITGFTFVDYDNDGFCWERVTSSEDRFSTHSGDGVITSASYDNDSESALTPDNWMILPTFVIPNDSSSDIFLTWYESGQDVNYASEYYSVYVSTTGRTIADFTATTPVLSSTTTGDWVKKTVILNSYVGQTINIAFRHYNVSDMFYLNIDDIRIGAVEAPELTIIGPRTVRCGDTAIYTADGVISSTLTWSVTADYTNQEGNTLAAVWNTPGTYTVAATATNASGSSSDSLIVNVVQCNPITSFPFVENFENEIPCWKQVIADPNNTNAFGVEVSSYAIEGNQMFHFSSYDAADDYNQYLITPEIQLPSNGEYMIRFYYYAESESEAFKVLASTTDDNINSFTEVLGNYESTVTEEVQEVAFSLPSNTKYVCINYYGDWVYDLYIDQLSIESLTAPTVTINGPDEIGTGNEATFTAISSLAESYAWTIDGTPVSETGAVLSHTFTTATEHTVSVTATNHIGTSAPATMTVNVFDCGGITLPYTPDFSNGLRCWTSKSDETEDMGWFSSVDVFESDPIGQVVSMSAINFLGMFLQDVTVDNWLISPSITMPTNGSFEVSWQVMPYTTDYPNDHYGVYILNDNDEETLLFEETLNASMSSFQQRVATIPATVSGNFRVAFRHFDNPGNGYVIILDNIMIVPAGSTQGIDNIENNSVSVYPTPANSVLTVEGEGIHSVQMFDASGRTVLSRNNGGKIDISDLASGIYVVRVTTTNGVSIKKVVKE